jgi:hypothetical protein
VASEVVRWITFIGILLGSYWLTLRTLTQRAERERQVREQQERDRKRSLGEPNSAAAKR